MMMLRITNAYIHDCRIANSAGRRTLGLCGALDCHVASLLAMTGGGRRPPLFAAVGEGRHETIPSCRICNSADESISICNAGKTADVFDISGMMMLRIANAYIHDCRIANSAGRRGREKNCCFFGDLEKHFIFADVLLLSIINYLI
jgi:hypothetical protein